MKGLQGSALEGLHADMMKALLPMRGQTVLRQGQREQVRSSNAIGGLAAAGIASRRRSGLFVTQTGPEDRSVFRVAAGSDSERWLMNPLGESGPLCARHTEVVWLWGLAWGRG